GAQREKRGQQPCVDHAVHTFTNVSRTSRVPAPHGERRRSRLNSAHMSESQPLVVEERRGGVLCVALNRPERHHALNNALSDELGDALLRASEDETVLAVIITGTGEKAFCAGGDMLEMSGVEE